MIEEFVKISLGLAALIGGWLWIDLFWQRVFGDQPRRIGCHGCDCSKPCSPAGGKPDPINPGEQ